MKTVKGFLLEASPRPGVVLSSEEDDGCDNIGVVGNELAIEVHKSEEGAHSFDRRQGMPVFDGSKFHRVHVDKALTNDHSKVFHGGSIKGALRYLEGQTMFSEVRKVLMSSWVM